ncbi:DUF305 domain-containing protein [Mycolicibacterium helvum]|uniref:DUF305 domain-containing protein n=1 Tax=Mycolicibacterium helvum TaxID=1534349 RepID=A0A7I7TC17_9MYCO|nr:DUF305 domain-containing protein [Mycolicibacterium helvum]BBY65905.1 DUF305 domain-containing protein [Mycolicibacterium helvum]
MHTRHIAVVATALAAVITLGACEGGTKPAAGGSATAATSTTAPAPANQAHNNVDVMFTQHMIPHHQQAIEMSDVILGKTGIDPRVIDLANRIKAAQTPEIQQMQGWLAQWGVPAMPMMPGDMGDMPGHGGTSGMPGMPGTSGMPGMPGMPGMGSGMGMMSDGDMDALRNAQGAAASKLFLTQMIAHHQGAITMSQREIGAGQSAAVIALATSITSSQQKEIDEMNALLPTL